MDENRASHLVVRNVSKRFGATTVLDRIDLTIRRGELVTLLGPSGCGKTTLLRLVAGLAQPDQGQVELAGRDITNVPPHRRNVGVVFQSYALFPHLTVAGNVAFGLKLRRLLQDVKATAIFVTHDQDEALTMSDRVAVMNLGRIEQLDEPRTLYSRPASLFALNFVGLSTRIAGTVVDSRDGTVEVETRVGRLSAMGSFIAGSPVVVAARPEHLRPGAALAANSVAGRVRSIVFQGSRTLVDVDAGAGESLLAELSGRDAAMPRVDEEIRLTWPVSETFAFPAEARA